MERAILTRCSCGKELCFEPAEAGDLKRCPDCGTAVMVPLESEHQQPEAQVLKSPVRSGIATAPPQDVPVQFGAAVPSAYQPSGQVGQVGLLNLYGAIGSVAGVAAAGGVAGSAALLNLVHNLLPVFIFVMPLLILALLAVSPGVLGLIAGSVVKRGVIQARCRSSGMAGFTALLWTACGLLLCLAAGDLTTPVGESFLADRLLPFMRLMVGGSINFTWLQEPEPVNVPAWMIYSTLGASAVLGNLAAYGIADDAVRATPFCERCAKHLKMSTLKRISTVHTDDAVRAYRSLDDRTIREVPSCSRGFKNWVSVEAWSCSCRSAHFLELLGNAITEDRDGKQTKTNPVRIFSRTLTNEQVEILRRLHDEPELSRAHW